MAEYKTGRAIRWDHFEHCPFPVKGGGDCWAEPHPASRHGLCVEHWREVVQDWVSDPGYTIRQCIQCGWRNKYDTADWVSALCAHCGMNMDARWLVEQNREWTEVVAGAPDPGRGVVYYVKLGNLIKIGFSSNLPSRMRSVPHEEILAAEPGDYALESARHAQFAKHKAARREWFHADAVPEFAASVRAEHGDPFEVAEKITSAQREAFALRNYGGVDRMDETIAALLEDGVDAGRIEDRIAAAA